MIKIKNPILKGFHPDPSIIRVGTDYYVATSTFQWFPGIQIHHSKDLKNWRLVNRVLCRTSQLDMRGEEDNMGVWAPCLSYDKGVFYIVYSDVKQTTDSYGDSHNYLVTTTDICGEWSEPIPLKSDFADYSLFHDGDKKWMVFPYGFADEGLEGRTIAIQEYCVSEKRLTGPVIGIFKGTNLGTTEGPHLYKYNGFYYLLVAEGGTSYGHAVTVARSRNLKGPYEVDPYYPMLTSRNNETLPLQKAGHADLVETQDGDWYMVHLCARPFHKRGKCILGRETAIQRVIWTEDGWLRLSSGGNEPEEVVTGTLSEHKWIAGPERDDFDLSELNMCFQTLRIPLREDTLSLTERPGFLRLKGKESLTSTFCQALVARRQQSFRYIATTAVSFQPVNPMQAAGLICYYNTYSFHYLQITYIKEAGKVLLVKTKMGEKVITPFSPVSVEGWDTCFLRAKMDGEKLQFQYSADEDNWTDFGGILDSAILTDEFEHRGMMNFTGAFVGMCCQDLSGENCVADFDYFEYKEGETHVKE